MSSAVAELHLIACLLSLPLTHDRFLAPERNPKARGWAEIKRQALCDAWRDWVANEAPRGVSLALAEDLFTLFWPDETDPLLRPLLDFYRRLASQFLEPAGNVLNLCQCGEGFPVPLGAAERGLLWQLLSLRLSPDFLPAIRVAPLPKLIQAPVVANQLTVDYSCSGPLVQTLSQGLVDCHLHSGSAFRYHLLWITFLEKLEDSYLKGLVKLERNGLTGKIEKQGADLALAADVPLFPWHKRSGAAWSNG